MSDVPPACFVMMHVKGECRGIQDKGQRGVKQMYLCCEHCKWRTK